MPNSEPLCLIIIPYDKKKDAAGKVVDYETVYRRLIVPAVEAAGLLPVRADEQRTGCLNLGQPLERLRYCDCALADLSTGDPRVSYQLGIRQAVHPVQTLLVYAAGCAQLQLEAEGLPAVPYRVSPHGQPMHEAKYRALLTERLVEAMEGAVENEVYRALRGGSGEPAAKKERIAGRELHATVFANLLKKGRAGGLAALRELQSELFASGEVDPADLVELLLSYRAVNGWSEIIELARRMPPALADSVLVQQQLVLALNWAGEGEHAEQALRQLIARRGPSSDSYGILGRIMKDRWEKALERGDVELARELLQKAASAYLKGFEADWRSTYPGVNAVTLMELKEPADPRRREILPVVHYAVEQRIRSGAADYWDYATLLELAALSCDEAKGRDALGRSLAMVREAWEPETTARDLRLVREARRRRGAECPAWAEYAESELLKAAERGTARP
uniref:MAP3K TRAFs-binding domain-containing protein n=1 Tax=Geobacter sp. (strain M21) TaxID=443144 RepID=C6E952_GEOSM